MKYYLRRNRHRIVKGFILTVLIVGGLLGLRYYLNTRGEVVDTSADQESQEFSEDKIVSLNTHVLNFGSVSWAEGASGSAVPVNPFSSLETLMRPDYDAWVGNLTCAIAQNKTNNICTDTKVSDFAKYFNVVALSGLRASDGSNDSSTVTKLASNNVQFFGRSTSVQKPDDCEVVSLPARFELKDSSFKQATLPIVLCAIDGERTLADDIRAEIKDYSQDLPVWVYAMDSGNASTIQRQAQYRSYIDHGADLVFGVGGPDVGATEIYEGKLIAYSLGRALGPNDSTAKSRASALIAVSIKGNRDEVIEWEKISRTCTGYDDLCIEASRSRQLKKPTYTYDFDIVAIDVSDTRAPKVADAGLTADVLSTLLWYDTKVQLSNTKGEGF